MKMCRSRVHRFRPSAGLRDGPSRLPIPGPAVFALLVVIFLLSAACGEGMLYYVDSPVNFLLPAMEGGAVNASEYRGKILLVQFWATWCPPCLQEIPEFNAIHQEFHEKGIEIVGIALDRRGKKELTPFLREHRVLFPILLANKAAMNIAITGIPTTFVIDRELNVVRKFVGYQEKKVFVEEIQKLLGTHYPP